VIDVRGLIARNQSPAPPTVSCCATMGTVERGATKHFDLGQKSRARRGSPARLIVPAHDGYSKADGRLLPWTFAALRGVRHWREADITTVPNYVQFRR